MRLDLPAPVPFGLEMFAVMAMKIVSLTVAIVAGVVLAVVQVIRAYI